MSEPLNNPNPPSLLPIKNWPHPWPSASAWRHLIFHSADNGLDQMGVIFRIGSKAQRRRILIHEERFFRWCEHTGLSPQHQSVATAKGRP